MKDIFNNNTYKQPIPARKLTWASSLIVIACVLLLVTLAILCIALPNSQVSLFNN
jgi:hypothetical protein